MEYTKGEWKSTYRYPHNVYATDGRHPPTTTPIATMIAPDQIECEANASLIAAAPDLFEALDMILRVDFSKGRELGWKAIAKVERG